jgi:glycosyltransferase involved in cell wall biosynthesis
MGEAEIIVEALTLQLTVPPGDGRLHGFSIDECSSVPGSNDREIRIVGWVLGEARRAVAVEICAESIVIERLSVRGNRPDVQLAYSASSNATTSGFEGSLVFATFPPSGLELRVVLDGQDRVPVARIVWTDTDDSLVRKPRVSVVIPCYRQSHFLTDSISSVLRQDYAELEVVVVDDESPDNTEEVVRRLPGVIYIRQAHGGLAAARNAGLKVSSGEFVIFLDADDRLVPGAISAGMSQFSENADYGLVAGQFRLIGLNGHVLARPRRCVRNAEQYLQMVADYFVGPPGAIILRRMALDVVGAFDPSINQAADYDMALRIARQFPVCVHDQLVLEYRKHGANMSADPASMLMTTMTALGRQWTYVRLTREGREAYRSGVRHWQRSWGKPLVEKVVADIQGQKTTDLAKGIGTLLRYYPRGLIEAVQMLVSRRFSA